jgi:SOS-response transcriptional repressor LexA
MGWATAAVERLRQGQVVTLRPRGHSMAGKVEDGDVVTVEPLGARELQVGDVVLVRVRGREYLHLIKAAQGNRYLIGNNRGGVNGWVGRQAVAGVAVQITSGRR